MKKQKYILLNKREGRTVRNQPEVLTVWTKRTEVRTKKDWLTIFSRNGPEQAWLLIDLLHNPCRREDHAGSFRTMPGPILKKYWTGNRAF